MAMNQKTISSGTDADRHWFIVSRWQQFDGERRVNLIRIIGILLFYLVELANYHGVNLGFWQWPKRAELTEEMHFQITVVAVGWVAISLGVFTCLKRRFFPSWLIYATVAGDIILLTSIMVIVEEPSSPLLVIYFLLLAMAATRFSLPLLRFATATAGLAYLFLLGGAKWFEIGTAVPRHEQAITLLSIILTGVVLGQTIRRVRTLANTYAGRISDSENDVSSTPAAEQHGEEKTVTS